MGKSPHMGSDAKDVNVGLLRVLRWLKTQAFCWTPYTAWQPGKLQMRWQAAVQEPVRGW